jgi:hypothetical protein
MRDLDPELAQRWLAAQHDPAAIADYINELLERNGGPLFEGYRAAGERPR